MTKYRKPLAIGALLLLFQGATFAQEVGQGLGKKEYDANCAVCHGPTGKGDGPLAGYLTKKTSDLTTISARNNGVFPFSLMQAIIDGREMMAMHGTQDMPAWGNEYNKQAIDYYNDYFGPYSSESFVRARVLALVDYLYALQAKE